MKTIRQIADELGVSKQTVYKRYKGRLYTDVAPYAHTEQGVLYIEEQGEALIKQDFLKGDCSNGAHTEHLVGAPLEHHETVEKQGFFKNDCSNGAHTYAYTGAHTEHPFGAPLEQSVLSVLQATIDTLQAQLVVKDKQIDELNTRLAESNAALVSAQQTAQAAQALHAGTIRQQLTGGELSEESENTSAEKRQGWLHRIFSK